MQVTCNARSIRPIHDPIRPHQCHHRFLGVGKTTAILHLLANKPADERWAVLVNEFGEIGVDGALMEQQDEGVYISEVPGIACAAPRDCPCRLP